MITRIQDLYIGNKKIELPLLIPAFTSKGFSFKKDNKNNICYSEITPALQAFSSYASDAALISAYDIHFKHFVGKEYPIEKIYEYFRDDQILFLDSGGYELMKTYDTSEIISSQYAPKPGFNLNEYEIILKYIETEQINKNWVITNFDYTSKPKSIDLQIEDAKSIFHKYKKFTNDFILKPFKKSQAFIEPDKIAKDNYKDLGDFDIIGVSEKDLGNDVIKRAVNIAKLRKHLYEAGVDRPLHIWGGLDPLITPIYFFAGAQIFDGVSWLRYAYLNGVAMNRQSYIVFKNDKFSGGDPYHLLRNENIRFMDILSEQMKQWVLSDGKNFKMFDKLVYNILQNSYNRLKTKINFI
jgi:hypothetical protein